MEISPATPADSTPLPRLLLVDDEPRNLQLLTYMLAGLDYNLSFASDGKHALELAMENPPDIVLLDVMMPEMDGYTVCERLRDNPSTSKSLVIFLTAMTQPRDVVRGFHAGAVDYVGKPFHAEELKARVRTHLELKRSREALERSNAALEEMNANQRRFFGLVAHDLRSPFNSLRIYPDQMLRSPETFGPERLADVARVMGTEINKVYQFLEELLEWAMSGTGAMAVNWTEIPLRAAVDLLAQTARMAAEQKEIALENEVPEGMLVAGDAKMVTTTLRNLIGNAVKFTHHGGRVTVRAIPLESGEIEVTVADTGVGMDAERLAKLFRPGEKNISTGTARERGSGMGLLLCSEFIRRHNGRIWAESVPAQGSVFHFTLPAAG